MQQVSNSILLQYLSPDELSELIRAVFKKEFEELKKDFNTQTANDDLMTREQTLELLKVNPSTLYLWQKKGKINVYKFSNKCYYKRSEILSSITLLKK